MKTSVILALPGLAVCLLAEPKRPVEIFQTRAGELKITPIRHAALMMQAGGQVLYIDPTSQGNYDGLPAADVILITDKHGDHMDPKAMAKIRNPETKILAPRVVVDTVTDGAVISNGERKNVGKWTIEAIPMYNMTRGPSPGQFYHDKGRGNGYVVTYGTTRIYIAGDTEGIPEMRSLKDIDVAFVPMNLPFTMTPEEAAAAVKAFAPKVVYPYHYQKTDITPFQKALAGTNIDVRIRDWYY
jgi:L-ascorbate metabolism protein UlaG (beta-lactamase superfamily)